MSDGGIGGNPDRNDVLPVDKTILADDDVTAVIRQERRLDEGPLTHATQGLFQNLQAYIPDLVVGDTAGIHQVVVRHKCTTTMAGFQQLRDGWVVPVD